MADGKRGNKQQQFFPFSDGIGHAQHADKEDMIIALPVGNMGEACAEPEVEILQLRSFVKDKSINNNSRL